MREDTRRYANIRGKRETTQRTIAGCRRRAAAVRGEDAELMQQLQGVIVSIIFVLLVNQRRVELLLLKQRLQNTRRNRRHAQHAR